MSVQSYTVLAPVAATPLAALLQALAGWPTVNSAGIMSKMATGPVAQLLISSPSSNTGVVEVGALGINGTMNFLGKINAGGNITIGSGSELVLLVSQIYLLGNGTDAVAVGMVG